MTASARARRPDKSPRTSRRPAEPPARPRRRWRRMVLKWVAVAAIWGLVALAGTLAWFAYDLPDIASVGAPERRPAITVLAADGAQIARYGDLTGDEVRVDELPEHLVNAVLAIEDRRFWRHPGIDPIGLARAMVVNLREGRLVQGGSTITQQLAKNLFLTPERTIRRKVQEMLLALWLEANYDKEQILGAYLNRVYLGAGTYGVDAAARTYFGISARNVSLHQGAILAGLLKAPSRYSPAADPELALERAEVVLAAMVDAGYLTRQDIDRAEALPPLPPRRPAFGSGARYFADWIADQIPDFAGYEPVDLKVTTTLDPALQRIAEQVVARAMAEGGEAAGASQVAVVILSTDGGVRAMIGGLSHDRSAFNRATQAQRQPGSAFKPFVYLAGLENGLRPDTLVEDGPININGYAPENFEGRYLGTITATEALARSANSAAVRVMQAAGIDNAIDAARRCGIVSPLRRDLSLALGASEVTLLELTGAYGCFARDGVAVWPYGVEWVETSAGRTVYQRRGGGPGEVVRPWHIHELDRMLFAVIEEGSGRAARIDRPAAGKTGTSQRHRDAWFVGFTADYIAGVWVGNDDGTPMNEVTGGGLPARIWHDLMLEAHRGLPVHDLPGLAPPQPMVIAGEEAPDLDQGGFLGLLGRLLGN